MNRVQAQRRQRFKKEERRKNQRQHQHTVLQRPLHHAIGFEFAVIISGCGRR